jgi:hypothetical protein
MNEQRVGEETIYDWDFDGEVPDPPDPPPPPPDYPGVGVDDLPCPDSDIAGHPSAPSESFTRSPLYGKDKPKQPR